MRTFMVLRLGRWSCGCALLLLLTMSVCMYKSTNKLDVDKGPLSSKPGTLADDPTTESSDSPPVDNWCEEEKIPDNILKIESDEMTVVTMFLDLGVFKKGYEPDRYHSPLKYRNWMRVFGRIANRVVAYIERDNDIIFFKQVRSCLPANLTRIIKVDRNELPSFKLLPKIRKLYSRPSYPKQYPSTVYPEYTCTMHAKYDVLERSILDDHFQTPYYAWLDIGLFRNLDDLYFPVFKMVPPKDFKPERISFSQVFFHNPYQLPTTIVYEAKTWVSGSMALGKKENMLKFSRDYRLAAKELLDRGLSNSDQEVINAMYSEKMKKPHYIKVQAHACRPGLYGLYRADALFFCLGYACRDAGEKRFST